MFDFLLSSYIARTIKGKPFFASIFTRTNVFAICFRLSVFVFVYSVLLNISLAADPVNYTYNPDSAYPSSTPQNVNTQAASVSANNSVGSNSSNQVATVGNVDQSSDSSSNKAKPPLNSAEAEQAYMNYLIAQNKISQNALCDVSKGSACLNISTDRQSPTPQINTYYVVGDLANKMMVRKEDRVVSYNVLKTVEDVKPDVVTGASVGEISSLQSIGNPDDANNKPLMPEEIPPKSSVVSLSRREGFYKSVFIGVDGGGFGSVDMTAQQNEVQGSSVDGTFYSVWTAPVYYIPSIYTGLRFGMQYPSLFGGSFPKAARWEVELSYLRLQAIVGEQSWQSSNTGPKIPDGFASDNLLLLSANGYVDLIQVGPGYPYVGAGIGFAVNIFDSYLSPAFTVPAISAMLGYDFDVSNGIIVSVGFKTIALMSTKEYSYYQNGNTTAWPSNQISSTAAQSNYADFSWQFIMALEVGLMFM